MEWRARRSVLRAGGISNSCIERQRVYEERARAGHACGLEDVVAHVGVIILAGQPLNQESQDYVSCIRIRVTGSRRELRRLINEEPEVILEGAYVVPRPTSRRGEDVAANSGCVPHQLADRDLVRDRLVRIIGPVRGERRIKIELSSGAELENGNLGKDLVDGAEVEGRFQVVGDATFTIGHAVRALENRHAVLRQHSYTRELASSGEAVD